MHQLQLVRKMVRIGNPEKNPQKGKKNKTNPAPFSIHISMHTFIHTSTHTCRFIDSLNFFPKACKYTYMCVSNVIFMFFRIHIQEAEFLSVRFPKEYDHINLVAKLNCVHISFKTLLFVIFQSIYQYIHPYIHPQIHAHLLMV